MKVHFISIGGSAMHNLAIALHLKGYEVIGSDDEIFDPAKSRLEKYGLLPKEIGWFPEKIDTSLDAVILGMHARIDNPELIKAKEIGIKVYSYPEYLYEQSKNKKRIVIGGSHGKTTITSMILHVLNYWKIDTDFMVGAQLAGFEVMVKLTDNAPYMVIEGDEYLTSPIDLRPKFHLYKPHIALISGIAWDHINVFPTFENYVEQFKIFTDLIEKEGTLVYCAEDGEVAAVSEKARKDISKIPYAVPEHTIENGITYLLASGRKIPLQIFGKHNLMNLEGARNVCCRLGITSDDFYEAIQSFAGASKRLELIKASETVSVFKDFAHSPSKLGATIHAVKEQFPERELAACIELHTFSSLTKEFLAEYKRTMNEADTAIVYFNPHTLAHKKLAPISEQEVKEAFAREDLCVFTDSRKIEAFLESMEWKNRNLLMMSSGNFDGIDFRQLADRLI